MSNKDIIPYDWYKRLFSGRSPFGSWNFNDLFREFDEMRNQMERTFSEPLKMLKTEYQKI